MNKLVNHGINFGIFAAISFGLMKVSVAKKNEDASSQSASAKTAEQLGSSGSNGPVLGIEVEKPSSRPIIETEEGIVYTAFVMDPFEVKISNERHGWTVLNARSPEHVELLAHSDPEKDRITEENFWTPRRELVYRKEVVSDLLAKAEESGDALKELILPGFAGDEFNVTVDDIQSFVNEEGIREGDIIGHLTGDPDSKVILGFYGDRESGLVTSPNLEQDINYNPREDGQILVKSVDDQALGYFFEGNECQTIHSSHDVGEPNGEL